ncbi:MAG TPA: hypothetical protein VF624_03025 [Tepidisphaeraceae bacterium]|jgi:hypothetical protein
MPPVNPPDVPPALPPTVLPPAEPAHAEHDDADLAALIELSRPRPVFRHIGTVVTLAWMTIFVAYFLPAQSVARGGVMALAFIVGAGGVFTLWALARAFRVEQLELDGIEDALALKQYPQAGARLEALLGRPMRSAQGRLRAMILLATLLTRGRRFEAALQMYTHLLEVERVAGPGGAVVRLGRVMAMLQSDHLYDADRAINDLRRLIDRGGLDAEMLAADAPPTAGGPDPLPVAGLRLIEMYRDIKTGHFREAIDVFEASRAILRRGLAHRCAEALALVAVAHDLLDEPLLAAQRFAEATLLQPVGELIWRYPEVDRVARKYPIVRPPGEG